MKTVHELYKLQCEAVNCANEREVKANDMNLPDYIRAHYQKLAAVARARAESLKKDIQVLRRNDVKECWEHIDNIHRRTKAV